MKTIKRSIALVLAMILTLAMSVTVFAAPNADQNTFSLTLNKAVEGHTYEAYQILSGDLSADKATLSNIKWGEGINAEGQTALGGDAAGYAKKLADMGNNSSELKDQAQIIGANLKSASGSVTVTDSDAKNVIGNLKPGYYLIKDKDDSIQGQDSYTEFILHVTDDVDANVKADVPSVEKKVKDTNDTTGETTGWQDSADYDIGDDVPFQLTATLANNIESYQTYSLKFNDTLSKGLDYNNDAVIKLGDKVVTDSFTPSYDATAKTLTFTCDNILAFGAKNSDKIVVEYTAKLNENAEIGAAGNPNKVKLEFSNNPNIGGEGDRGETPEDTVIVFTYKVVINKEDENKNALDGAKFTLYKKIKNAKDKEIEAVISGDKNEIFTFSGLDDGDYVLKETEAPDGYNKAEDIEFTIKADHSIESDAPELKSLSGDKVTGEIVLQPNKADGSLSKAVPNTKGIVLPSTGGAGRVAIYVIGAILVVGGGIVLVTKKRVK